MDEHDRLPRAELDVVDLAADDVERSPLLAPIDIQPFGVRVAIGVGPVARRRRGQPPLQRARRQEFADAAQA
jgi:hypothetical protein